MSDATLWWIAAGVLVGLELLSGTFYLLMLALGASTAAVLANLGASTAWQMMVGGAVGGAAVLTWHLKRQKGKDRALQAGQANPDLHLDVGQMVDVTEWQPGGTARVHYRGAQWDARHHGTAPPQPGPHRIRAVEGNQLILEKH